MIICVLPDSKAVEALFTCYSYKRVYHHDGKPYFVTDLKANGTGESSRLQATLEPVSGMWEQHQKSYESIFGLSKNGGEL
ncbi:hypothetical protein [Vibrio anguillarum]|uniref:Uncharacterized protein n=1 Tax=Vibrio anguillarum TaxID=55601 RepID=A0AAW4B6S4_VIBAN|nr:hypothetical protein [Vibrio anguillarum]MBF4377014.1 hypothetical protein [Vibrio anguillarum]MBF4433224.1 hypothetical protein [Vibrio anguillarum]